MRLFLIAVFLYSSTLFAAEPVKQTKITSDLIRIRRHVQQVEFIGNAKIDRGDDVIFANRMILFYEKKAENIANQSLPRESSESGIKMIDIDGAVKIFSDDMIATSAFGRYEPGKKLVTLERNVVVNRGSSVAKGAKFVYNVETKRGSFIGKSASSDQKNLQLQVDPKPDKGRAILIINPKDKGENE